MLSGHNSSIVRVSNACKSTTVLAPLCAPRSDAMLAESKNETGTPLRLLTSARMIGLPTKSFVTMTGPIVTPTPNGYARASTNSGVSVRARTRKSWSNASRRWSSA